MVPTKKPSLRERLKQIRDSTTVSLKPTPLLKDKIRTLDGELVDFKLRYYQVQGVYHMLVLPRMVLGDDTGLGKCVTAETLVQTDQGLVPIWQLAPDGELEPDTFYEPKRPIQVWTGGEWAPVRRFYWNGDAETRKVRTRNGYTIEGSLRHPILVRDIETGVEKFVKLPDLDPDRHWVCIDRGSSRQVNDPQLPEPGRQFGVNTRQYRWPAKLTPDLARLLGYVVGEAWTGHEYVLNVSQHRQVNPETHDDIRYLFREVYGWESPGGNRDKDKLISVNSVMIREHLRVCGVAPALSAEKTVPWTVLQGSDTSVVEFLRGLFEGEGSVCSTGGVEFTSASHQLAHEVHQLLLLRGVVSTLSPKTVRGRPHTYWRIQFFGDDARVFQDTIGFVSSRKSNALRDALNRPSNPNKDVVPGLADLFEQVRDKLGNISRFGNSVRGTLTHVARGRRNPTYKFLDDLQTILGKEGGLQEEVGQLQPLLARRRFYDPITTIEEGFAPLMDIEVDHPSHAFVGNGLVNHNTVETIAALCYLWQKEPQNRVIVVSPKSAIEQWADEIRRFSNGVEPLVVGTEKPDPTATCTCSKCGTVWQTKKVGKQIACPKCELQWTAPVKLPDGSVTPELIRVERESPVDARRREYERWVNAPAEDKLVLILTYKTLVLDWNHGGFQPPKKGGKLSKQPVIPGLFDKITKQAATNGNLVVIYDEATAFKNDRSETWEKVRFLADRGRRVYALTATLLKNHLFEGYCIYKAIKPGVFTTKKAFYDAFCYVETKKVAKARITIINGYRNLDQFRATIDPVFLGRKKHMVAKELPTLTTKLVTFDLSGAEDRKYEEALGGILELGDGEVKDFEENKALTSLIYCQMVVNSLSMLRFAEGDEIESYAWDASTHKVGILSSKEQALVDLLTGELDDEKVIIYTRFASLVPRLQAILKREGIKSEAITGKVTSAKARRAAQEKFQDPKSDTTVIFITAAGSEAINLQVAKAMIFFDMPWSWGEYLQAIGRMIRIGSPNSGVLAIHLVARRPDCTGEDAHTIDHYVLKTNRRKKAIIDKVLGEGAVGALKFKQGEGSSVRALLRALQGKDKDK